MTTIDTTPGSNDAVPPRLRTVTYVVSLCWGALATGIAAVVAVLVANGVTAATTGAVIVGIAGAVSGVVVTICGGLGTAYRPPSEPEGGASDHGTPAPPA
ncbi:MAG: hypothetical protein FWF90_02760 [Promicromonosporaceae bacterium]|nr:hypothetical protein [Promicromonosporaceae bacterium]